MTFTPEALLVAFLFGMGLGVTLVCGVQLWIAENRRPPE